MYYDEDTIFEILQAKYEKTGEPSYMKFLLKECEITPEDFRSLTYTEQLYVKNMYKKLYGKIGWKGFTI